MTLTGKILIIDDEANLRQTFTRILRQAGHQVTTAGDGDEALKRLASAPYDLAFLDIRLPGGRDGLEILKEVHQRYPVMPVILFTGHASLQSAMDAVRLGASDYLIKPVAPEILLARTENALAQQSIQRRKREIQEQLAVLQAELKSLEETPQGEAAPAAPRPASSDRYLKTGPVSIDLQTRRATFEDQPLILPPATFDYLVVLVRHTPDTVSYQLLVTEAQGYYADARQAQELAKWHIHEIRRVLEADPRRPRLIINVRGTGYRLVLD
jgi:DNA-binding response OmpR family regulator